MSEDEFDREEFAAALREQQETNSRMIEALEDLESAPAYHGQSSRGILQGLTVQIEENNRSMAQLAKTVAFDVTEDTGAEA